MIEDDTLYRSTDHNAGSAVPPTDLETTRVAAHRRANTAPKGPVRIYQHVGGRHPQRGQVGATETYMWRDVYDVEGRELELPKFYWQAVETVVPSDVS